MKKRLSFLILVCAVASKSIFAQEPIVYTSPAANAPLAPAYLFNSHNSIGHGIEKRTSEPLGPRMTFISDPATWGIKALQATLKAGDDCNIDAMLALPDGTSIVNYLKTHTTSCIGFLWTYDSRMTNLFTTSNITSVLNEISNAAGQYVGDDTQKLDELLTFVRLAYYQNFYHPMQFDKAGLKPTVVATLTKLFNTQHIFDSTNVAGGILNTLLNTVDCTETDTELLAPLENTLQIFLNQMPARLQQYNQQLAIYSALYTLSRAVNNRVLTQVDCQLLTLLKSYGLLTLAPTYDFVANNGLWTLGQIMVRIPSWSAIASNALEAAYRYQTKWNTQWLWSVRALTLAGDCKTLSTGEQVCLSQVRADLKAKLFPQTYNYENGFIKVSTALTQSDVTPLYYATKEVKAQFGRIAGHLTPVPNDPNAVLKVIIYASPDDYSKYHTFLFNLDSNNGGIYIEQDGTYYTYQRTSAQSIYTLQELARHEYTHYLVGRYFVQGMWGSIPLYNNNRMVFFDEGIAEFFAGSTPRDDVALRYSLINQIKNDKTSRLHINQILSSTYGDFKFYRYAGTFFHFLSKSHLDIFKSLNSYVSTLDTTNFDNLVSQLKANTALDTEYQNYLTAAVTNIAQIGTPSTNAPQATDLSYSDPAQIANILTGTGLSTTTPACSIIANQTNILFNCKGQISGPSTATQDNIQGWYTMDQAVNQFLKASAVSGANLNWMNCWFDNVVWTANGPSSFVPSVNYSCDGPLGTSVVASK